MPTMANIKLCLSQTFNANILSTNYTKVYNWKVYRKLVWFRSKSFQLWLLMLFFDRIFCLKSDSHLPNKFVLFALLKPFKTIYLFVMSFWSCRKNGLIRKISLTAKFMTPQPGQQTIAIQLLTNILRNKGNQAMKIGQLICAEMRLEDKSRTSFYFLKSLNEVKESGLQLSFDMF